MTNPDMQPAQSLVELRAHLQDKEEQHRKLVRQLDAIARTEFRDRAQRLKQMRDQRALLETEIDQLRERIRQMAQDAERDA